MFATDDWVVTDTGYEDGRGTAVTAAYTPTEDEAYALGGPDLRVVTSTRSRLARNGTDLRRIDDGPYDISEGSLESRFRKTGPIRIAEGDAVLRLAAYHPEDRLDADAVYEAVCDQPGKVTDRGRWFIPFESALVQNDLPAETGLTDLENDKNRYLERTGDLDSNAPYAQQRRQFYETVPVEMPDDVWGIIRTVQDQGYGRHFHSPIIDPGFADGIVAEIDGIREQHPLGWPTDAGIEIALYRDTTAML